MTIKYFLDKHGVPTKRIAGKPGSGHIEIAMTSVKLDPHSDVYQQMFSLGYVRIVEIDNEVHVDAPRALTVGQKRFLESKRVDDGKAVFVNDRIALESRTTASQAKKIVDEFLKE
jgi:hypothetical protein